MEKEPLGGRENDRDGVLESGGGEGRDRGTQNPHYPHVKLSKNKFGKHGINNKL